MPYIFFLNVLEERQENLCLSEKKDKEILEECTISITTLYNLQCNWKINKIDIR